DEVLHPWFFAVIGAAVASQILIGMATGLYRGKWRVATFEETVGLGTVWVAASTVAFVSNLFYVDRRFPIGSALVGAAFAGVMMLALRAVWRVVLDRINRPSDAAARVLVFGAGEGGFQVIRAMMRDADSAYLPV